MNITKDLIKKFKQIDLIAFCEDCYGVNFSSKYGNTGSANCPHPDHDDSRPSFSVWKKNDEWYWCCHGCHCGKKSNDTNDVNFGTDILAFVQWMSCHSKTDKKLTFVEACKIVAKYAGIILDEILSKDQLEINKKILENNKTTESMVKNLICNKYNSSILKYLYDRGLDNNDILKWSIGFNGDRISFPLFYRDNSVRGFSMRKTSNDESPKYINSKNSEIFNKSQFLYGINKISNDHTSLIITEGQFDVIMAHKYGLDNTVASCGTALNESHLELIKEKLPNINKIIFIFDADEAGKKALIRASKMAYFKGFGVSYVDLPQGQDLCDFAVENKQNLVQEIQSKTLPYFYKELKEDMEKYEQDILIAQNMIYPKILDIYNKITNEKERLYFISFVKNKFNIDIG